MTTTASPSIGHNNPPPDLKVGEALKLELAENHLALVARRDELLEAAAAFAADHQSVNDDETSGTLAALIVQLRTCAKSANQTREGVKAPYLDGSRIVDGFFTGGIVTKLDDAAQKLNRLQTAYLQAKEAARRRQAEEEARIKREAEDKARREAEAAERERQRAEREARKATDDAAAEEAERKRQEADERARLAREEQDRAAADRAAAQRTASKSSADLSRTRGDMAQSSLRTVWRFEVVDLARVPLQYLQVNTPAISAAIRNGEREIAGLRIFAEQIAANR